MITDSPPRTIHLNLAIGEPEIVAELNKYAAGPERDDFARSALRIGVLALRQASGHIDANAVRVEGERLVGAIREILTEKLGNVASTLKIYFDPAEGHLPQRLDRLLKKDGELQSLLAQHLDGDQSVVARTLARHIGKESPLLQMLAPEEKQGVIAALTKAVGDALQTQRDHVLHQFSLDDKESALSRLVLEMTGANGQLRQDLAQDVQKLQQEFSLDNEQGALSRLVARVEKAQRTISQEFSLDNKESALCRLVKLMETANASIHDNLTLDNENSPLYRLRRELTEVIDKLDKSSSAFHQEVRLTLESFKVRREADERSTQHGNAFQDEVGAVLQADAQKAGDLFEATGNKVGVIPYCKVGDYVITLGSESVAAGARIAVEAKEDKSYHLTKALQEIEQARKNREAQIGLFVYSKQSAPTGLAPFVRHGQSILVIWDQTDSASDIFLQAGVSVAKALVVRERLAEERSKDMVALRKALEAITKEVTALAQISKWAQTVKRTGDKIGKKADLLQKKLTRHLLILEKYLLPDAAEHAGENGVCQSM
ncbi:MAG: hypothetical protein HYX68_24690 [Planctomycetes bacterium]|nr:hypothetical protein [Planctomycetota bacterium]